MGSIRTIACWIIGIVDAIAGIAHFTHADFFRALVPDVIGACCGTVNVLTGILQTALGTTFLLPKLRVIARWGTTVLLVATLPAAFNQVLHPEAIGVTSVT